MSAAGARVKNQKNKTSRRTATGGSEMKRAEVMAHNIKKYLDKAGVDQVTLAKWWRCSPTYINQIVLGRRALGDVSAKKMLKFFALHGIHISQAHLLVPPAAEPYMRLPGGRTVPVLDGISDLRAWRKERIKGYEIARTLDKDSFYLEVSDEKLAGGPARVGDLLLVSPNSPVADGNLVIAQVGGVITLRRYRETKGGEGPAILESPKGETPIVFGPGIIMYRITQIANVNP